MKAIIKKMAAILLAFTLILPMSINVHAASGYQGYAIYRDGVFLILIGMQE